MSQVDVEPENDLSTALPTRWEIELEFVQSLSNIQYLNYLAQSNHLQDPKFINYLKYLQYWTQPEYAKYLVYPNCLHILTLLQNKEFRESIVNPEFMNNLMNDMVKRWQDADSNVLTPLSSQQPPTTTDPVANSTPANTVGDKNNNVNTITASTMTPENSLETETSNTNTITIENRNGADDNQDIQHEKISGAAEDQAKPDI